MTEKKTLCLKALKCAVKANGMIIGPDSNLPLPWCPTLAYQPVLKRSKEDRR